jgi:membrane protease YdiL (CAAX protease family)
MEESSNKNIIADFLHFLRKPSDFLNSQPAITSLHKILYQVISLCSVGVVVAFLLVLLSSQISFLFGYNQNQDNLILETLENYSVLQIFLLIVIAGPFFEELSFRLLLDKKFLPFIFGTILFFLVSIQGLLVLFENWQNIFILSIGLNFLAFFVIIFLAYLAFKKSTILNNFLQRNFSFLVWFSVFVFGINHVTSYRNLINYFLLIPIVCSPQIFVGFIFAYFRVKFNFLWAFISHAIYNFMIAVSTILVLSFLSEERVNLFNQVLNSETGQSIFSSQDLSLTFWSFIFLIFFYLSIFIIAMFTISKFLLKFFIKPQKS